MDCCPSCQHEYEVPGAKFCSHCGAPNPMAEEAGGGGRPPGRSEDLPREDPAGADTAEYRVAVDQAWSDGALDEQDRRQLERRRRDLGLNDEQAGQVEAQVVGDAQRSEELSAADLPVLLEINDCRFYVEDQLGVIDLRIRNLRGDSTLNASLRLKGNYMGECPESRLAVGPQEYRPIRAQVLPTRGGEHMLELVLVVEEGGYYEAFSAQPILRVLRRDENPSNVTLVIDQRMQAGQKIGYGLSVQNKVEEGLAKGLIRSSNDLLTQRFPDSWRPIELFRDELRTRQLNEHVAVRVADWSASLKGRDLARAAIEFTVAETTYNTVIYPGPSLTIGRGRGVNDLVLRVMPRCPTNDSLSQQIQRRGHIRIALEDQGLVVTDGDTANGTMLDGQRLKGQAVVAADQPSELEVGQAMRLRLMPFRMDGEVEPRRYDALGPTDPTWEWAMRWGIRSLVVERSDELAQRERYVLVFAWASAGTGPGHEIVLPESCPHRRCFRILRLGRKLWIVNLSGAECLSVQGHTLEPDTSFSLRPGIGLSCSEMTSHVRPIQQ
jgi:FHA domain